MTHPRYAEEEEFDLESRVLCEDDACIGVIGPMRACGTCGRPYSGLPQSSNSTTIELSSVTRLIDYESEAQADPDIDERVLCSDDACIGIIGPLGRCGTCGKLL
ncbi:MAG: hypothetical protein MUC50_04850 [Myxococcota bacterium]|nr:hypothetical protein [Myxococcota bacterium]